MTNKTSDEKTTTTTTHTIIRKEKYMVFESLFLFIEFSVVVLLVSW